MADAGLLVSNVDSDIVIDSEYANLAFVQRKTKTMDASPFKGNSVTFYNCNTPLVVMGNTGGKHASLSWTEVDGDDYSYSVIAESNGGTGEFFLFDKPTDVTDSDYGMKVWNDNGDVVFNSSYPYFQIMDIFEVSTRGEDISKTYDRKIGVVLNRRWCSWVMTPPPVFRTIFLGPGALVNNNKLDIKQVATGAQYGAENSAFPDKVQIIVVDLSTI